MNNYMYGKEVAEKIAQPSNNIETLKAEMHRELLKKMADCKFETANLIKNDIIREAVGYLDHLHEQGYLNTRAEPAKPIDVGVVIHTFFNSGVVDLGAATVEDATNIIRQVLSNLAKPTSGGK